MVGGYVDAALAERFQAWALQTDGGGGRLGRAAAAHPPGDGRSDAGRAEVTKSVSGSRTPSVRPWPRQPGRTAPARRLGCTRWPWCT